MTNVNPLRVGGIDGQGSQMIVSRGGEGAFGITHFHQDASQTVISHAMIHDYVGRLREEFGDSSTDDFGIHFANSTNTEPDKFVVRVMGETLIEFPRVEGRNLYATSAHEMVKAKRVIDAWEASKGWSPKERALIGQLRVFLTSEPVAIDVPVTTADEEFELPPGQSTSLLDRASQAEAAAAAAGQPAKEEPSLEELPTFASLTRSQKKNFKKRKRRAEAERVSRAADSIKSAEVQTAFNQVDKRTAASNVLRNLTLRAAQKNATGRNPTLPIMSDEDAEMLLSDDDRKILRVAADIENQRAKDEAAELMLGDNVDRLDFLKEQGKLAHQHRRNILVMLQRVAPSKDLERWKEEFCLLKPVLPSIAAGVAADPAKRLKHGRKRVLDVAETRVDDIESNDHETDAETQEERPQDSSRATEASVQRNIDKRRYTKDQVNRAYKVRALEELLGYPSEKDLKMLLHDNRIEGCTLTPADVDRCYDILGPNPQRLKGFSVARNRSVPEEEMDKAESSTDVPSPEKEQNLYADIFFIAGQPYLLTFSEPLHYLSVTHLRNKGADTLATAMQTQYNGYAPDFTWKRIYCDGEGGIQAAAADISAKCGGARIEAAPGTHCSKIERRIRIVKEVLRAILAGLPYQLPLFLMKYAVQYAVNAINQRPRHDRMSTVTPWEQFFGRKIRFNRDCAIGFGRQAQCIDPVTSNSMKERSISAIALYSLNNLQGSFRFFTDKTSKGISLITRHRWVETPMSEKQIATMNELARKDDSVYLEKDDPKMPVFSYKDKPVSDGDAAQQQEARIVVKPAAVVPTGARADHVGSSPAEQADVVVPIGNPSTAASGRKRAKKAQPAPIGQNADSQGNPGHDAETPLLAATPAAEAGSSADERAHESSSSQDTLGPAEPTPKHLQRDGSFARSSRRDDDQEYDAAMVQGESIPENVRRSSRIRPTSSVNGAPAMSTLLADVETLCVALEKISTFMELEPAQIIPEQFIECTDPIDTSSDELPFGPYGTAMKSVLLNMTVGEALKYNLDAAQQAIVAEFAQLSDKQVFQFLRKANMSGEQIARAISCSMFLKDKFDAEGKFIKMKGRFVAGGHRQDRTLYSQDQISSPTVAISSLMAVVALAARERRHVATMDIGGAYLNADMEGPEVIIKIPRSLSGFVADAAPTAKQYIDHNGNLYVKLRKALYGCLESGRLWYNLLTQRLSEFGFVANPHDRCVFNRTNERGNQVTVCLYVDDLLITCADPHSIEELTQKLSSEFKECAIHFGENHSYLGMLMDFSQDGVAKLTMPKYVDDILKSAAEDATYKPRVMNTPASEDLFSVDPSSPLLSCDEKTNFHTMVARCLYLSKRTRPDIIVAVNHLTTRVQAPTVQDRSKLHKLYNYLSTTRALGLTLGANDHEALRVIGYADASYAVHPDRKSQSGGLISLGRGCIDASSNKQSINTKSSCQAEIVSQSDYGSVTIGMQYFLQAQGYELPPALLWQDNQSAIKLTENGVGTKKSAHIEIRYFWLHDEQKRGHIQLEYCPTNEMIADILTKPLQGAQFVYLRALLLGLEDVPISRHIPISE